MLPSDNMPFIFLEFQITEMSSDFSKRASTPPLGGWGVLTKNLQPINNIDRS